MTSLRHCAGIAAAACAAILLAACGDNKAEKANWVEDPRKAVELASKEKKALLIAFTGSDWSTASQEMQREVLDTPYFKRFADKNLILYLADFPRNKTLPPEIAQHNQEWAKQSRVDSLPTYLLVVVSPSGQMMPIGGVAGTMPGDALLNQLWKRIGVQVTGEVEKPDWVRVPVGDRMTLSMAVKECGGLSPRSASNFAVLTRQLQNGTSASQRFNVKEAMSDPGKDIILQIGDTVRVLTPEENDSIR